MSKKATKQSRATARRKARQRARAERTNLEHLAAASGIRNAALMSSERLRTEIAWKRGGSRRLNSMNIGRSRWIGFYYVVSRMLRQPKGTK